MIVAIFILFIARSCAISCYMINRVTVIAPALVGRILPTEVSVITLPMTKFTQGPFRKTPVFRQDALLDFRLLNRFLDMPLVLSILRDLVLLVDFHDSPPVSIGNSQ